MPSRNFISTAGPRLLRLLFLALGASLLSGCSLWPKDLTVRLPWPKPQDPHTSDDVALRTVHYVDLPRYMGDWRVIGYIPYFPEKGCIDSIQSYALRPDGRIENWFTYRTKSFDAKQKVVKGEARVINTQSNADWRIKYFGVLDAKYYIIDLDPGYQWTVIGHPSRKQGWIMAREKTLPDATYAAILDRLAVQGYDPGRFVKVPQYPHQLPPP